MSARPDDDLPGPPTLAQTAVLAVGVIAAAPLVILAARWGATGFWWLVDVGGWPRAAAGAAVAAVGARTVYRHRTNPKRRPLP